MIASERDTLKHVGLRTLSRELRWLLAGLLFAGILVARSPEFWAVCVVEVGAFTLCAICIARKLPLTVGVVPVLLAAAIAWGWVQVAAGVSVDTFETRRALLYWTANLAMFVAAASLLRGVLDRAWFRNALLWFGCVLNVTALVQMAAAAGRPETFGPFVYRNQYAAFVELLFPLALFQALRDRRGSLVYLFIAAGFFASVVGAASRAGIALLLLEWAAMVALARVRRWLPRRILAWSVAVVLALSVVFAAAAGWENIESRLQETESYQVRRKLVASTIAMIRERPWTGFGLGTWRVVYPAYATFDSGLAANQAHNDWAEWTAEGGIGFALLLLAAAAWSAAGVWRHPWALGVPAVFLHSLVDYPLREPALASVMFALMGALAAARAARHDVPGAAL